MKPVALPLSLRRALALIILLIIILVFYWVLIGSWFISPLLDISRQMDEVRLQQQHYRALLEKSKDTISQQNQTNTASLALRGLLQGDEPALVAASLMSELSKAIQEEGDKGVSCEIVQQMPITTDPHPERPYQEVGVSMMLKCRIKPLMSFLHQVESRQPWLIIETFSIHRKAEAEVKGGPGKLDVQLLIKGYMQRSGQQGTGSR